MNRTRVFKINGISRDAFRLFWRQAGLEGVVFEGATSNSKPDKVFLVTTDALKSFLALQKLGGVNTRRSQGAARVAANGADIFVVTAPKLIKHTHHRTAGYGQVTVEFNMSRVHVNSNAVNLSIVATGQTAKKQKDIRTYLIGLKKQIMETSWGNDARMVG